MKTKFLLLLAFVLLVGTLVLTSCDISGLLGPATTTAGNTTTAPAPTTEPVTTTVPVTTTAPVTTTVAPVDPFEDVALADGNATYNGEAKTLTVTGAPAGAVVTYAYAKDGATVDAAINVGTYTVTATVSYNGESVEKTATLTIAPATVTLADVTFDGGSFVYSGETNNYTEATNLPAGITVTYAVEGDQINVGSFTVTATFAADANHKLEGEATKTVTYTITAKAVDMSGVIFRDDTAEYDPTVALAYVAKNLPDGVSATYTYLLNGVEVTEMKNVGVYTVVANFESQDSNYKIPDGLEEQIVTFTITKKSVAVGATFADSSAVYTGAKMTYEAATGFNADIFNVVYTYTQNGEAVEMKNAGEYTVTATFTLKDAVNYEIVGDAAYTATFTITKADIDLSAVAFPAAGTNYFKGEAFTYGVDNLPKGVTVTYTYTLNGAAADALLSVGTYTVTATLSADNYNIPADKATITAEFTILNVLADMSGVKLDALSVVYDGKLQAYTIVGLPAGINTSITYTQDGLAANPVEAGVYAVAIVFSSTDYTIPADWKVKETTLTITQKEVDLSGIVFNGATFEYDGEEKTYTEATGADLFNVAYTDVEMINVGTYTVTATFTLKDTKNYKLVGDDKITATFKITKKKVALEATFANGTGVYNGATQKYEAAAFDAEKFKVIYTYSAEMVNVGEYTVTATFALTEAYAANHVLEGSDTLTATYTITKAEIDISGVSFVSGNGVYTGLAHTYEAATGYGDLTVTYIYSADMINVGEYSVTATFTKDDNYMPATITVVYTITPKATSTAGLGLAWNIPAGATKVGDAYAIKKAAGSDATYAMVLDEAALAANGIKVTYTTTKLGATQYEPSTEVTAPVAEYGDYVTVATFTALNDNYTVVDSASMTITWGIYDENWTPVIK